MSYRVETSDGEMTYGSLDQLREAMRFGLVKPDDLVREDDRAPRPVKLLLRVQLPPARSAELPDDEKRGHPAVSIAAMFLSALVLAYLELPRLTVWFPWLWDVPGLLRVFPHGAPGGPVPLGPLGAWITLPSWLGLAHVAAGALLLVVLLGGLWASSLQSAAFLVGLAAYFGATGRFVVAGAAALGAALLVIKRVRLALKRRRRRRSGPPVLKAT